MKKVVGLCGAGLVSIGSHQAGPNTHWGNLAGKPAIWHLRERANKAKKLDKTVLWTEDIIGNQPVKGLADKWGLDVCWISSLNSEDNIRIFQKFLDEINADVIVDLTPHFPLTDPETIDLMVEYFISKELDLLQREGFPGGMTPTLIYSRDIWKKLEQIEKSHYKKGELLRDWKWLSEVIKNPDLFKIKSGTISAPPPWHAPELNFNVATPKGFALTKKVYERFYVPGEIISAKEVLSLYREDPEWFKFLPGSQLEIEVTNDCNLKCIMCPRTEKMKREIGYMDFDLFKKIIDETESLSSIHFSGPGEPLLHPQIKEMLAYAKEKGFKIGLWTSGLELTEELSEEIIDKGFLDYIIFGLDAATKETYAKVKGIDIFDKAIENINRFLELKKGKVAGIKKDTYGWWGRVRPVVDIQILKMKETDGEIEEFMNQWDYMDKAEKMINYRNRSQELSKIENEGEKSQASRKLNEKLWETFYTKAELPVEHAIIGHFDRYCGQIEDRSVIDVTPLKRFTCRQLSSPTVLWNGDVLLCRHDLNEEYILGNLREHGMEEISKRTEEVWQAHRDGKYDKIPLCNNCKEWYYDFYA